MRPKSSNRLTPAVDLQALLVRAVTLHQNGRLAEAAPLYEQVLRRSPGQVDALHLLGLIRGRNGDPEGGIDLIRRAVAGDGGQPAFHASLAGLLEGAGRWAEAADSHAAAARLAPLDPDHHRREGASRAEAGQPGPAAAAFRRHLALLPGEAGSALGLGDALQDLGRPLSAAAWYGRALALTPGSTLAAYNRGVALRDAGRRADALAAFQVAARTAPTLLQAREQILTLGHAGGDPRVAAAGGRPLLALVPDHAEAAKILGAALARAAGPAADREMGVRWLARAAALRPGEADTPLALATALLDDRPADAAGWFRRALALAPGSATALSGLGLALAAQGAGDTAPRAARRAARAAPGDADIAANAGSVLHRARRDAEAEAWYRQALTLAPDSAMGWINSGAQRLDGGAFEEAIPLYARALALGAGHHEALARSNLGAALMALGRNAEAVEAFRAALAIRPGDAAIRSNLLFCLCFVADAPPDAVFEEHRRFERFVAPVPLPEPSFAATVRDPERRLRVGYLSPDFQRYPGPGYHFLLPLVEQHDRAAVEVTCYYNDWREDEATARFRAAADRWRGVAGLPDAELERQIRADGIDLLVDCGGHMSRNRMPLFPRRPAPLQLSLPLYPNTTGLTAMDYQLADPRIALPAAPCFADARHSEKLIRLPDCVLCYRPADSAFVPPARPPAETAGVFTFASFNNVTKVDAATIALWARLLRAAPEARLLLKWRGLGGGNGSGLERRLLAAFAAEGVGAERLLLRGVTPDPYEDYVRADVALDPVFANGGTTICDALWMGVPVLNRAGAATISRWGATLLHTVGLDALVTESDEAYLALGVRLATDRAFLAELRADLRGRVAASPLMDEAGYARAVEAGFRAAWRRWCAGLPPAAIDLSR
ncbi:O-linked N-acetylglucosamine transferase family protein [Azospirillum agricola]|uniref:O-linked N-acetylglucosamine transferase family protein n=1 Tax=Azospirillum agricola TaxID=1720247 RepID=UPI000A0F0BED|nr:tetratricopeptide repeat protein [Azospirillum agricola]SMH30830.1 Predicted O-linked N-acetylglucosamine transferase, SPINDLY family [Azospirillum lipoferum]